MKHRPVMLRDLDNKIAKLLPRQILQENDPRFGGFWTEDYHVEPRQSGFFLGLMVSAYVTEDSRWYLDSSLARAIRADLVYMHCHQRPDGCFDLTPCNYASPPDTAFMVNAMLNGWWLMEKCTAPEAAFIREPMYRLIETAAEGISHGGFHTPNHRWAISACLLNCENITGSHALGLRAAQFLQEGLDINGDGEFAERSAGNYNQVNDDQMIRLYIATGDKRYLEAAAKNLKMMYCYFDPDGSIFTNNSTRQDMGKKVWADTYYILYLLVGYLLRDTELCRMAGFIWQDCEKRGSVPGGVEWVLLYPQMDGYGEEADYIPPVRHYDRLFKDSQIARIRENNWSCSLLQGKANCLYFMSGSFCMYMTVYSNLCDRRNFLADSLEKTDTGYVMRAHAAGWYYLPFDEKPDTSDWWAMDNPHTRKKTEGLPLDTVLAIVKQKDGIDLHITTTGIDQLPLRLEFAFLPGGTVRTKHFIQHTKPGESINVLDGIVEATGPAGEGIILDSAFGAHDFRDRMSGAYPLSENHYTVLFTAYTPVDRIIRIRAGRLDLNPV